MSGQVPGFAAPPCRHEPAASSLRAGHPPQKRTIGHVQLRFQGSFSPNREAPDDYSPYLIQIAGAHHREEARSIFLSTAPLYQGVPGLLFRKVYMLSQGCTTVGGAYLWNSRAEVEAMGNVYGLLVRLRSREVRNRAVGDLFRKPRCG